MSSATQSVFEELKYFPTFHFFIIINYIPKKTCNKATVVLGGIIQNYAKKMMLCINCICNFFDIHKNLLKFTLVLLSGSGGLLVCKGRATYFVP